MPRYGRVAECWCCGRDGQHGGRGLCRRCYNRWRMRGFTGPGPGPEFTPAVERAYAYLPLITSLSARDAAARLRVSARTVQRWRSAARAAERAA